MGMSERFDDIIAGLVSKIARLRFNGPPKTALRNAASKSDNIVEAQNVFEVELLQGIFKGLGRTAIFGRDAGFMLGDRDPGKGTRLQHTEFAAEARGVDCLKVRGERLDCLLCRFDGGVLVLCKQR